MDENQPVVSTQWLADNLGRPDLKIIDGSWRMPGGAPAIDDYRQRRIPGAVFFDIDAIADRSRDLPHMAPTQSFFEEQAGALGVRETDMVVVYDDKGVFSAPRVWWTFMTMGHRKVAVLNGGLVNWETEGRTIDTGVAASPAKAQYLAQPLSGVIRTAGDVRVALDDEAVHILDARPAARFLGDAPEPRAGLRSGHMPGAASLPFTRLLDESGALRPISEIEQVFAGLGIKSSNDADGEVQSEVITTCGSGVTAAVISLALAHIGHRRHGLYDGSWAEWGDARHDEREFPVATGE
ncbi:MAG: sulfurtransferase [Pseudomonadota bacterium]